MHFAGVDLGDERRDRRLPQLVDELARHPAGTLPQKLSRPADLEAFYRLCDADDVTHAAVLAPHRQRVLQNLQSTRKFLLVVHDGTEWDFSKRRALKRLGQIGNGHGRGYIVYHSLVVDPRCGAVLGLANQILHTRPHVLRHEGLADKRQRESRESRLWLRATAGLPARRQVVDVCDAGADTFEFLEHEAASGRTFVIRVTHDRRIVPSHAPDEGRTVLLWAWARGLAPVATGEVQVRVREQQERSSRRAALPTFRTARLNLSAAPVRVLRPHNRRGEHGNQPLALWVVRIWEPHPPAGVEGLEWLLLTNHPCGESRELQRVRSWYEWRWVVEEFHKCQKTGCGVEDLQLREESRLEPALGILSIVALLLLQLRDAARSPENAERRAAEMIPPEAIAVLSLWRHGRPQPSWTIRAYFDALARLGGYRRRKDCPPGWQVLWRGHTKLQILIEGARLTARGSSMLSKKCAKS